MAKAKEVTLTAMQEYRQAVSANPQNAEAHSNLGWGCYGEGLWDEAVKEFTEALRLDPKQVDALYGLALTRKAAGAKTEAVETFNQAVTLLGTLDDKTRAKMLSRLAHGHMNMIQSGDWKLTTLLTEI